MQYNTNIRNLKDLPKMNKQIATLILRRNIIILLSDNIEVTYC